MLPTELLTWWPYMEVSVVPDLNLAVMQRIHIVGVGGAGMSAIAEVLATMGHEVTGSDLKTSASIERLRALGVTVRVGHKETNLGKADLVTRSTAVGDQNVECRAARRRGIPVFSRAQVLGGICSLRDTVAVAGTHGKTTTASMLALVLREAGLCPSFIIGGDVNEIGSGAVWDNGQIVVVEADESDGSFLNLEHRVAVVTNVEPDHLEYHGDFDGLRTAFRQFVEETDETTVIGVDDEEGARLAEGTGALTVGTSIIADWRMDFVDEAWEGVSFDLIGPSGEHLGIRTPLPGLHNARNAALAAVAGLVVGSSEEAVVDALARFGGVARRFEHRGTVAGIEFVDDYAHLPTEVKATIQAGRSGNWGRLVVVFQPHRYSRTESLAASFGQAFDGADVIYVTEVFPAGEPPRPGVTGRLVADAVRLARPDTDVRYEPRREDLVVGLIGELREGDLCLTMGAGDLTSVPDEVRDRLEA